MGYALLTRATSLGSFINPVDFWAILINDSNASFVPPQMETPSLFLVWRTLLDLSLWIRLLAKREEFIYVWLGSKKLQQVLVEPVFVRVGEAVRRIGIHDQLRVWYELR